MRERFFSYLVGVFFLLSLLRSPALGSPTESVFVCKTELKEPSAEQALASLEKRYSGVRDLTAQFEQIDTLITTETKTQAKGKVYFRKPGMMDWHYDTPRVERFVSDGFTLWYHQPELNQVQLFNFTSSFSSDLPVSFLLGLGSLREPFSLVKGCQSENGETILELNPKKDDNSLVHLFLSVDKDFFPTAARIVKRGGNTTEILLSERAFDKALPDSQFSFVYPKGIVSLDRRTPAKDPVRPVEEKVLLSPETKKSEESHS